MKVLLYFEGRKLLVKSGIGRAYKHQKRALEYANIEVTTNKKSVDYDILHINTYGTNSINMVRKARKLGKKVVYHAHSTEEDFKNSFVGSNQLSPLYKKYLIKLYTSADEIITPTEYSKKLLKTYGITKPITAVSNGIHLPQYQPNAFKENAFREIFEIKKNEKVVIGVGLYFDRKGIVDFVELARRMPDVRFIWFGSTPRISIPPHIWKIISKDHPQNVEFPGYIKGDILEGAYSSCDCFFFPSYEETEGIVVLEALASKQKVLVRDIPVYDGWLVEGKNCRKAKNNEEFEQKLREMLASPMKEMREEAYKTAQKRSIPEVSKQLEAVYKRVLGN